MYAGFLRRLVLPQQWRSLLKLACFASLSLILVSCENVAYYGQAARGQLGILLERQDIERTLADADTPSELRQVLEQIQEIRNFAEVELQLPVGGSYASFVELDQEHVLWNVFAAPEFSLDPMQWCYPIAGCVSYRGYFSEQAATRFADRLAARGYDVYTGGVDAYSTLGWFDDPVFSVVFRRPAYQLAGLVFHELAHQLVYLPGDTTFNESFATFIEQEGVQRWLLGRNDLANAQLARQDGQRQADFVRLVTEYRDRFAQVYASELSVAAMRAAKSALQEEMRSAYGVLRSSWGDYRGYDRWFDNSLNNAQLSTVASYNELVPAFSRLLDQSGGDLEAFYTAVRQLVDLDDAARRAALQGEGS